MKTSKIDWITRLISLSIAGAIFCVPYLRELDTWVSNFHVAIQAVVWVLLVIALIGTFAVEIPKKSLWWSLPLTALWIVALAYAGRNVAMVTYIIITIVALGRRFAPEKVEDPNEKPEELRNLRKY